jgi:hypothetical protein
VAAVGSDSRPQSDPSQKVHSYSLVGAGDLSWIKRQRRSEERHSCDERCVQVERSQSAYKDVAEKKGNIYILFATAGIVETASIILTVSVVGQKGMPIYSTYVALAG